MTNILARIHEDEQEYQELCQIFGEAMVFKRPGYPDIYGAHAEGLRHRYRARQAPDSGVLDGTNRTTSGAIGQP